LSLSVLQIGTVTKVRSVTGGKFLSGPVETTRHLFSEFESLPAGLSRVL
jgi:hypothetical protein